MTPANVEDYGVKVEFDNSQFNKNVESSEKSLNSFKDSLSSFSDDIKNRISFAGISLGDLLNFAALQTGFYSIRSAILGLEEPVETLSQKVLGIVSDTINKAAAQVKNGGMSRALNIEAAKFQIEGLKLDVETFMEAADYAVSGTAYSLDAAAKAASQFGASGVTELEELKKALRAISGTAAMANSDFESIAHIFTTVAGQGKLTSMQLQSLSYRGLNVAATLGKYLGKTEEEIRKMVSGGQISFKTFADAMDDAFGEHAKDANKTFTGAMSNINAALSRLGEAFATPYIQNAIDVFNQIRLSINELKKSLQDNSVFEVFSDLIEKSFGRFTDLFESFRKGFGESAFLEEVSFLLKDIFVTAKDVAEALFYSGGWGQWKEFGDHLSIVVLKAKQLYWAIKEAIDEVFGINSTFASLRSFALWVVSLLDALEEINDLQFKAVIKTWFEALKSVFDEVTKILGLTYEGRKTFKDTITAIVAWINKVFSMLWLSEEEIRNITTFFGGIATIIANLVDLVVNLFNFIQPVLGFITKALLKIGSLFTSVISYIGQFFNKIGMAAQEQKIFERFFDVLSRYLKFIGQLFKDVGKTFADTFFNSSGDSSFIDKIFEFIQKVGELASAAFDNFDFNGIDFTPIQNFIKNITNLGFSDENEMSKASDMFDKVKGFIGKIFDFITKIFTDIQAKSAAANAASSGGGAIGSGSSLPEKILEKIGSVLEWVKGLIETLIQNTDPALFAAGVTGGLALMLEAVADILDVLLKGIAGILTVILGFVAEKDLKHWMSLDLDELAKVLDNFGKQVPKFLEQIKGIAASFKPLGGFLQNGMAIFGPTTKEEGIAKIIRAFALLFVSIAASLFVLALIPTDDLFKAVGVIGIMSVIMSAILIILVAFSKFNNFVPKNIKEVLLGSPLSGLAKAFEVIAISFIILSIALKKIADAVSGLEWSQLAKVGVAITGMVALVSAVLIGFTYVHDKVGNDSGIAILSSDFLQIAGAFALMSLGILEMSAAISLLAKAVSNDPGSAFAAAGMVAALLIIVATILGVIGKLFSDDSLSLIATGGAIMLAFGGLGMIISSIAAFLFIIGGLDKEQIEKANDFLTSMLTILGVIVTILSVIGLVGGIIGEMGSVGLLAMAVLITQFAILIASLAIPLLAASVTLTVFTKMLEEIRKIIAYMKDLSEEDADKIGNNIGTIIKNIAMAIPVAIGIYIKEGLLQLKGLLPTIVEFISSSVVPFIKQLIDQVLSGPVFEHVFKGIQTFLDGLILVLPTLLVTLYNIIFGPAMLLDNLLDYLDELWDRLVVWLKERIPVWTEDIADILLLLIKSINAAMEGKWEEFDEEISKLIQNTISLTQDILTGAKTVADIKGLVGTIIQTLANGVQENAPIIKEAFKSMASEAITGFFEGLTDGSGGSTGGFSGIFGGLQDMFSSDSFTIKLGVDDSDVTKSLYGIRDTINGYDTMSIFDSNNIPAIGNSERRLYQSELLNNSREAMAADRSQNVNVTVEAVPNKDNLFDLVVGKFSTTNSSGRYSAPRFGSK